MSFSPRPVRRRASAGGSRRTLYTNIGFGLVVVVAVLILAAAGGASWYQDHFGSVATVDGVTISRDQYRDRYDVELFRNQASQNLVRDEFQAGRMSASLRDAITSQLQQQAQSLQQTAYERLIDLTLEAKLAGDQGLSATDADVDAELTTEATKPERRHAWVIAVTPEISTGAAEATDAQKAAAKAKADQALADLKAGKAWEDVAKAVSTDTTASSGGDLGWIGKTEAPEAAFGDALFAAQKDTPTDVLLGDDGTFRIGRVTDIAPSTVDTTWQTQITNAGLSLDTYRRAVRLDVLAKKLQDKITSDVVGQATPQRKVSEIYIAEEQHQGSGDEIHVRHILYAPNDLTDTTQIAALPSDDPGWAKAKEQADAAYAKLEQYASNPTELETQFQALANQETDDPSGKSAGGDLPWFTQGDVDPAFGDAIFAAGHKTGDLIGPVKSSFGYHVILWEGKRPTAEGRINAAALDASGAKADFAAVAKQYSEGPEASSGGDIGWVARNQLSKQLEDAIFGTAVGSVSQIVDVTGDGWYLFKVTDEQTRKPDGAQAQTLQSSAFSNWYTDQKAKATIVRDLTFNSSATG